MFVFLLVRREVVVITGTGWVKTWLRVCGRLANFFHIPMCCLPYFDTVDLCYCLLQGHPEKTLDIFFGASFNSKSKDVAQIDIFFSRLNIFVTTSIIGEQSGANSTENSTVKVNNTYLMNKKLKYTMNTCRSSMSQGQIGKQTVNLLKRQFWEETGQVSH